MVVIIQTVSWSCSNPSYFALECSRAGKITGENKWYKQKQIDVQEARKGQEVSSGGERGKGGRKGSRGSQMKQKSQGWEKIVRGSKERDFRGCKKIPGVRFTRSQKCWGWQSHPRTAQSPVELLLPGLVEDPRLKREKKCPDWMKSHEPLVKGSTKATALQMSRKKEKTENGHVVIMDRSSWE